MSEDVFKGHAIHPIETVGFLANFLVKLPAKVKLLKQHFLSVL